MVVELWELRVQRSNSCVREIIKIKRIRAKYEEERKCNLAG